MSISPVNLIVQNSYTNKGNKYKKTNAAKTVLTTAGAIAGASFMKTGGSKTANAILGILSVFAGLGAGTFIDGVINKGLSIGADKKANSGDSFTKCGAYQG